MDTHLSMYAAVLVKLDVLHAKHAVVLPMHAVVLPMYDAMLVRLGVLLPTYQVGGDCV